MLTPSVILQSLLPSCAAQLPVGTTLLQSGAPTTSVPSSAWVEFWVDRLSSTVTRRNASPGRFDLSLTVNCFGRPPVLIAEVQSLSESIRRHLSGLHLTISDDNRSAGLLSLQEAEMRDLSRPSSSKTAGLCQWTVTVRGLLQTCPETHN